MDKQTKKQLNKHIAKVITALIMMERYNANVRISDTNKFAIITDLGLGTKWHVIHVYPDGFLIYHEGSSTYESMAKRVSTIISDLRQP